MGTLNTDLLLYTPYQLGCSLVTQTILFNIYINTNSVRSCKSYYTLQYLKILNKLLSTRLIRLVDLLQFHGVSKEISDYLAGFLEGGTSVQMFFFFFQNLNSKIKCFPPKIKPQILLITSADFHND